MFKFLSAWVCGFCGHPTSSLLCPHCFNGRR